MTPEEKARIKIDQWFADAGWKVVNREDYEPTCTAVAIREGLWGIERSGFFNGREKWAKDFENQRV